MEKKKKSVSLFALAFPHDQILAAPLRPHLFSTILLGFVASRHLLTKFVALSLLLLCHLDGLVWGLILKLHFINIFWKVASILPHTCCRFEGA